MCVLMRERRRKRREVRREGEGKREEGGRERGKVGGGGSEGRREGEGEREGEYRVSGGQMVIRPRTIFKMSIIFEAIKTILARVRTGGNSQGVSMCIHISHAFTLEVIRVKIDSCGHWIHTMLFVPMNCSV